MALRPPFQYYGAKGRLAPFLAGLLGPHEVYCEPFAGSAAVFFAKDPIPIETINDINGDLVCFMKTLRDRPRTLIRAIEFTPYARAEHQAAELGDTPPRRCAGMQPGCGRRSSRTATPSS
ncbi:DNA adenine methylase [Nonomuraea sp. NPDC050022]|uniref:DNA adenine methylase n=1 Tax=unclassified Nonomuraea TaxID=2593643 RepID=UPI0033D2C960